MNIQHPYRQISETDRRCKGDKPRDRHFRLGLKPLLRRYETGEVKREKCNGSRKCKVICDDRNEAYTHTEDDGYDEVRSAFRDIF